MAKAKKSESQPLTAEQFAAKQAELEARIAEADAKLAAADDRIRESEGRAAELADNVERLESDKAAAIEHSREMRAAAGLAERRLREAEAAVSSAEADLAKAQPAPEREEGSPAKKLDPRLVALALKASSQRANRADAKTAGLIARGQVRRKGRVQARLKKTSATSSYTEEHLEAAKKAHEANPKDPVRLFAYQNMRKAMGR